MTTWTHGPIRLATCRPRTPRERVVADATVRWLTDQHAGQPMSAERKGNFAVLHDWLERAGQGLPLPAFEHVLQALEFPAPSAGNLSRYI